MSEHEPERSASPIQTLWLGTVGKYFNCILNWYKWQCASHRDTLKLFLKKNVNTVKRRFLTHGRLPNILCSFVWDPPQTFQQWISPLLGLCSRELFGGPRKFFFTLHDNTAWQKKGENLYFCYRFVRPRLLVSTNEASTVTWAWYTPRRAKEGREGIGESAELMMPTLRDSTMSHPGENSHQVRVKAYYKG